VVQGIAPRYRDFAAWLCVTALGGAAALRRPLLADQDLAYTHADHYAKIYFEGMEDGRIRLRDARIWPPGPARDLNRAITNLYPSFLVHQHQQGLHADVVPAGNGSAPTLDEDSMRLSQQLHRGELQQAFQDWGLTWENLGEVTYRITAEVNAGMLFHAVHGTGDGLSVEEGGPDVVSPSLDLDAEPNRTVRARKKAWAKAHAAGALEHPGLYARVHVAWLLIALERWEEAWHLAWSVARVNPGATSTDLNTHVHRLAGAAACIARRTGAHPEATQRLAALPVYDLEERERHLDGAGMTQTEDADVRRLAQAAEDKALARLTAALA